MEFDLNLLADRLRAAADRSAGLKATVSGFDLILSKDGYGTGKSESVPFAALFLRADDALCQALDRLQGPLVETSGQGATPNSDG
jgi:hypothetical protein